MGKTKRLLSVILVVMILLSIIPTISLSAAAEDTPSGSINSDVEGALRDMGFNTDTSAMTEFIETGFTPLGENPFSILTIDELVMRTSTGYSAYDFDGTGIDLDKLPSVTSPGGQLTGEYVGARSVAFDPTGSGKNDHIAEVSAHRAGDNTNFTLIVYDSEGKQLAQLSMGSIPLHLVPTQVGAFLQIAAGNFDGDDKNKDEIAVYNPTVSSDSSPRVSMVTFNADNKALAWGKEAFIGTYYWSNGSMKSDGTRLGGGLKKYNFLSSVNKELAGEGGGAGDIRDHVNHWPSVSLATVSSTLDGCDDLAVAHSLSRSANDRDYSDGNYDEYMPNKSTVAYLSVWINPLGTESSVFDNTLDQNWSDYSASGGAAEKMIFPGVSVGDIDGDKMPEIVVAGYRLKNPSISAAGDWDIDEDRFLITYYDYDIASTVAGDDVTITRTYQKNGLMQWVSMKPADYKGHTNIYQIPRLQNGDNDFENMWQPIQVGVFAEHGTGTDANGLTIPKSVFANGIVLSLPVPGNPDSTDCISNGSGMLTGNACGPDGLTGPMTQETFFTRYSFPLEMVDDSGYGLTGFGGNDPDNKAITELAVGNFENDVLGREQIIFTYNLQQGGPTNAGKYSTVLCFLSRTGVDLPQNSTIANKTGNPNVDAATYFTGARVGYKSLHKANQSTGISICAADVDEDSIIVRPKAGVDSEFYFSDPDVVAILQAAPYYEGIDYGGDYSTSITATTGTGSEMSHGFSVGASASAGFKLSVDGSIPFIGGLSMNLFEISATAGIHGGYGKEWVNSETNTVSKSFTALGNHTVVLSMVPYIRYYYETWNPETKEWDDMVFNLPRKPRMQQISVATYDRVAEENDWPLIGEGGILDGIEAGNPASYPAAKPHETWSSRGMMGGDTVNEDEWLNVASGDGETSVAISRELSWSQSHEWNAGVQVNFGITLLLLELEGNFEADYFGSSSSITLQGTEYSGTVPGLPDDKIADYDFDWQFGTYLVDINNPDRDDLELENGLVSFDADSSASATVVLGYRVRNCIAPPRAPKSLYVVGVTPNSATLGWKPSQGNAQYYELGRVVGDSVLSVKIYNGYNENNQPYDEFVHPDTGLSPGESYQYVVRAFGYSGQIKRTGEWSAPVWALTPSESAPYIMLEPEDLYKNPGDSAEFSIQLSSSTDVQYHWQKRNGSQWEGIPGATSPNLSIASVREKDDGTQYRCVVLVRDSGGHFVNLYSRIAALYVTSDANPRTNHTVTFSAGAGGLMSAVSTFPVTSGNKVLEGEKLTFTAVPNSGYIVKTWIVDGQVVKNPDVSTYTENIYTISSLAADVDVRVEFERTRHVVNFGVEGGNGSISASAAGAALTNGNSYLSGISITFAAVPSADYIVDSWWVDGRQVAGERGETFTVNSLQGDLDVKVKFRQVEHYAVSYKITGTGWGTVAFTLPNGDPLDIDKDTILHGTAVTATFTPDAGTNVNSWTVNNQIYAGSGVVSIPFTVTGNTDIVIDTDNITGTMININHAMVDVQGAPFVYNGTKHEPVFTVSFNSGNLTEGDDFSVIYGENTNAGAGQIYLTAIAPYEGTRTVLFVIDKADPSYTLPQNLTASYGNTLADVNLPMGFVWEDSLASSVGEPGNKSFLATFTPDDTVNYETLTGISILVQVKKAIPTIITPPIATQVGTGDTLAMSALSGGQASVAGSFAWKTPGMVVNASGQQEVIFTPADSDNYDPVTLSVNVGVAGALPPPTGQPTPPKNPTVIISDFKNGNVTVDNKAPNPGDTVNIDVKPDDGYEVGKISVKDENGNDLPVTDNGNGEFSFIFSGDSVTVEVKFVLRRDRPTGQMYFSDVKETDWFYGDVKFVWEEGLMVGISDTLFASHAHTTRAMVVTILWRLEGEPVPTTTNPFTDVNDGAWYTDAVVWGYENGIILGLGDGNFGTRDDITREQLVTILYRYAEWKGLDVSAGKDSTLYATDAAEISDYALPAMRWAYTTGLIKGRTETTIVPAGTASRAEFAAILHRFLEQAD